MLEYLRPGPNLGVVCAPRDTLRRTVIRLARYGCLIICVFGVEVFHFVSVVSAFACVFTRASAFSEL